MIQNHQQLLKPGEKEYSVLSLSLHKSLITKGKKVHLQWCNLVGIT